MQLSPTVNIPQQYFMPLSIFSAVYFCVDKLNERIMKPEEEIEKLGSSLLSRFSVSLH